MAAEECCSDYVVSSYTPTLGVLLHARRPKPLDEDAPSVLLTAAATPPSWRPLRYARDEINVVKDIVPPSLVTVLPEATLSSMIIGLPHASVVHIACHGKQDTISALESGFILADGTLTVAQLMALNLPRATLAVLSACETAKGDEAQPDQAVHLAAAMLFAGFRSVVATMWYVMCHFGWRMRLNRVPLGRWVTRMDHSLRRFCMKRCSEATIWILTQCHMHSTTLSDNCENEDCLQVDGQHSSTKEHEASELVNICCGFLNRATCLF